MKVCTKSATFFSGLYFWNGNQRKSYDNLNMRSKSDRNLIKSQFGGIRLCC